MNKQTLTLVALASLGLGLLGCNSGKTSSESKSASKPAEKVEKAVIAQGNEADLFPMKVGNSWVYDAQSNQSSPNGNRSQTLEVAFKISEVVDVPEGKEATLDVTSDGKLTDRMKWRATKDGLYQLSGSRINPKTLQLEEIKFEPALRVIAFPIKDGDQNVYTLTGLRPAVNPGPFKATLTTDGIQEVDSSIGRMSALSTTQVSEYAEKDVKIRNTATCFWAPKVGIVRYYQEVVASNDKGQSIQNVSILRLKSHNP